MQPRPMVETVRPLRPSVRCFIWILVGFDEPMREAMTADVRANRKDDPPIPLNAPATPAPTPTAASARPRLDTSRITLSRRTPHRPSHRANATGGLHL